MTWVDIGVLGFIAISGLLALGRGLVREVLGIAAWAGSVGIAITEMPVARPFVAAHISKTEWVDPASFAALFLISLVVLSILARIIGGYVRDSMLGGIDRTLGLVFGVARGASVIVIAYIIAQMVFPIDRWPDVVLDARVIGPTYQAATWLCDKLPEEYRPRRLEPPPQGKEATVDSLLRAAPQGRATGKPPSGE